ncbi:SGNH/GDSL hydrolase family protein [Roseiarcus fermentans]|uniref:SGNH/GDSL hydrolase family protein n=1 Tax=Roseiarcus fermentans TaxID=1473586 RepID=UPI001FE168DD|nr:SGNH/GDSL hydrolase family protein [Roseiarcus fermentans]
MLAAGLAALAAAVAPCAAGAAEAQWITTWAATPAPRWAEELPAPFGAPETLGDQTLRQIARISVGGDQLRAVFSNEYGTRPMTIGKASVALSTGGSAVDPATLKPLTFGGSPSAVIPPGARLYSDPVDLATKPLSSVAVSLYLPKKTGVTSVHWDGAQTGYISGPGDETMAADFKADSTTKSRLFLSQIQTNAKPDSTAIVFFGDSITDGACSTPDSNGRWPDHIAERLQKEGHPDVAVVNEAYSGDRVLTNGMGTNALSRFDMSVLGHPRVSTVVMMMGINDIGWPGKDAITPGDPEPSADDVIAGYKQIIDRAHEHGLRFVAVTLTPFVDTFKGLPTSGYYTPEKEQIREAVNAWIRSNKTADGLIDFDKIVEDPNNPKRINPAYDCGDHLHPNDAGYKAMAQAVDLNTLVPAK